MDVPSMPYLAPILAAAAEEPDGPAVTDLRRSSSRRDLVLDAGGLARRLARQRGTTAAVLATDAHEFARATIGTLAAGWTLVPLDPQLGADQLAAALDTAAADVILAGRGVGTIGTARRERPVIDLALAEPAELTPVPVQPDRVAVLFRSSGSTGEPKLLPRTYGQLAASLTMPGRHLFEDGDRVGTLLGATGAMAQRTLDVLSQRASLHCLDARRTDPAGLLAGFVAARVTVLHLVPTYLRRLLDVAPQGTALPSLRLVVTSGEALQWDDVAAVRARLNPRAAVRNRYGSTDAARVSSRLVGPDEPLGVGTVPVGHPYDGSTVTIVGEDGEPVPSGELGEVVVASPIRRDVPGRVDLADGRSRYRTGDLGRLLPDGQLELLGRVDRLVKIGGIRVQPARIEGLLRALPWVDDALVLPEPGPDGVPILIAHVVGTPGPDDLGPDLSLRLRSALHPAEIPERLVIRPDPFPTLPTGKVDGMRLRAEDHAHDDGRDAAGIISHRIPGVGTVRR